MGKDDNVGVYAYDAPTGRRLDTPNARKTVFTVGGGLTPADDHRLKIARQHFIQASAEDFDQDGKDWVDRATGARYRLVRFDPTMSDDPSNTGVTLFFLSDGWLVYLAPVGATGRSRSVQWGTVGGVKV